MKPVQFFKILSNNERLLILILIKKYKELCVCDLTQALTVGQSATSRHLAQLKQAGLLEDERRKQWVYYKLSSSMADWQKKILDSTPIEKEDSYIKAIECFKSRNNC